MSLKTESVQIECGACSGTGIYHGFAEPKGVGVVCVYCDGSGCQTFRYAPFTKRQHRGDIATVRRSVGTFIATGVGPTGDSVTYQEFIGGKMPKRPRARSRAYEIRTAIDDYRHVDIHFGESVAKVRADVVLSARDAWPDLSFKHVKVRFVGIRETPAEIAQRQVNAFNAYAPIGTWVLVRQIIGSDDMAGAFCTRVRKPGAYVCAAGYAVVQIPADCYAIECVTAIRWERDAKI